MKIIAESPEENKILEEVESILREKCISPFYTETFEESYAGQVLAEGISKVCFGNFSSWTPSQRLWFLETCNDFYNRDSYKNFISEYQSLLGIYDQIFQEEEKVLTSAISDYALFLKVKKNCELLNINSYSKLMRYLNRAVVKGPNEQIKTVSYYYDATLSKNVIELNSIKIPFSFKDKKLQEESTIYAWSDTDFMHSFEFLKYDLMQHIKKNRQLENITNKYQSKKANEISTTAKKVQLDKNERIG